MKKQPYFLNKGYLINVIGQSLLLTFVLSPICSFSQTTRQNMSLMETRMSSQSAIEGTFVLPLHEMEFTGIPYLNEEFLPCDVLIKGIKVGSMIYRYNAYNEEIQVKKERYEENGTALLRDKDVSVLMKDGELIFEDFLNKDNLRCRGYLLRLSNGKYALYKRQNIKFTEAKKAQTSFDKDILAKFTKFKAYYLQSEDKQILELKLSNKALLKSISSEDKERLMRWKNYKAKKIKNESDLIDIVNFLNQS